MFCALEKTLWLHQLPLDRFLNLFVVASYHYIMNSECLHNWTCKSMHLQTWLQKHLFTSYQLTNWSIEVILYFVCKHYTFPSSLNQIISHVFLLDWIRTNTCLCLKLQITTTNSNIGKSESNESEILYTRQFPYDNWSQRSFCLYVFFILILKNSL